MLSAHFELHGVRFQTLFAADIPVPADLAFCENCSWRQHNLAAHICVPDIQGPDDFPHSNYPQVLLLRDSGTHPYASVAGSEVRLVFDYSSAGVGGSGRYLSDSQEHDEVVEVLKQK